ncbi:MAG: hypothetical protein H2B00_05380 [Nitrosopumilaceae archaeon]|uniref:Uncharacterized protein n=2 Tax=Candidatus Nitrosomaritimum aestuariumsis TaxID=3342354 RepID=A0AC60VZU6_9ARCH|nr:hypothetical protein [Nitrosopumilaceae archaeon]MBA4461926.1 hypothetical protein [Nitrosopumilaceae archaeon]MBA4463748.1 hypothetical protein [Nitrosopumilaceae archaeon]NCF21650.1 hypothetical protein [Nitrosopumilaceae archaeon]
MSSDEEFWHEKNVYCKYCGSKLTQNQKYCSEECQQKDSVWDWTDD